MAAEDIGAIDADGMGDIGAACAAPALLLLSCSVDSILLLSGAVTSKTLLTVGDSE